MTEHNIRMVFVTAPDQERASHIASALVDKKLAACVNILPGIRSIYRWQGKIENDSEVLLVIKTTAENYPDLERAIVDLHPYDTPEVLGLDVASGYHRYCDWIMNETSCRSC